MSNKNEKKVIVITGRVVLRAIMVLAVLTVVVFTIVELVNGTPLLEIFTENPIMWASLAITIFVTVFLFGDEKEKNEAEEQKEEDSE